LALLKPRTDFYAASHPGSEDVLLVVEVADASADYDRQVKLPLYARYGVAEVWLVDLEGRCLEVYRAARLEGYGDSKILRLGERVAPQAFPDLELAVDDILG
jgi:Uma2 family endonuclease